MKITEIKSTQIITPPPSPAITPTTATISPPSLFYKITNRRKKITKQTTNIKYLQEITKMIEDESS